MDYIAAIASGVVCGVLLLMLRKVWDDLQRPARLAMTDEQRWLADEKAVTWNRRVWPVEMLLWLAIAAWSLIVWDEWLIFVLAALNGVIKILPGNNPYTKST
jgi:hypothetical protein